MLQFYKTVVNIAGHKNVGLKIIFSLIVKWGNKIMQTDHYFLQKMFSVKTDGLCWEISVYNLKAVNNLTIPFRKCNIHCV